MSSEARYFRVGLFVLTGATLLAAAVVVLSGQEFGRQPLVCETYFEESVQGLEVGSPIKFRGVKLGVVSEIGLVNDYYELGDTPDMLSLGQRVLVRMEITTEEGDRRGVNRNRLISNLQRMIDGGLRLKLTQQGITGLVFIEADYGDPNEFYEKEFPWTWGDVYYVPSARSTIEWFKSSVERLVDRLEAADLEQILANIDELLTATRGKLGGVDLVAMQAGFNELVTEMRETNRSLRVVLDEGSRVLEEGRFAETGASVRAAVERASATLTRLEELIESGAYDATAALENLRVAAQSLRDLTDEARGYPSHMLFGEKPPASPVSNR